MAWPEAPATPQFPMLVDDVAHRSFEARPSTAAHARGQRAVTRPKLACRDCSTEMVVDPAMPRDLAAGENKGGKY
jgi:hypothetical protein